MGFGAAIGAFYSGYFKFEGRSCRSEFWWSFLFKTSVYVALLFVAVFIFMPAGMGTEISNGLIGGLLVGGTVFYLINYIPNLAIRVRRFHDQNQSGWMVLLGFIPYVGNLIVLVFMMLDGTHGSNRFGEDPLGYDLYDTFS